MQGIKLEKANLILIVLLMISSFIIGSMLTKSRFLENNAICAQATK